MLVDKVIEGLLGAGYNAIEETIDYKRRILVVAKCGASVFLIVKRKGEQLSELERLFNATYTGLCFVVFSLEDAKEKLQAIDARHA